MEKFNFIKKMKSFNLLMGMEGFFKYFMIKN